MLASDIKLNSLFLLDLKLLNFNYFCLYRSLLFIQRHCDDIKFYCCNDEKRINIFFNFRYIFLKRMLGIEEFIVC